MSSPTKVALRVLQLTSNDSSPAAKVLRRKASLRLKAVIQANPVEGKKILAAMKQAAVNPRHTIFKRAMSPKNKAALAAYLKKETDLDWSASSDPRDRGWALEFVFWAGTGKIQSKIAIVLRPAERAADDETKADVQIYASQGHTQLRSLGSSPFTEMSLKDLGNPSKVFPSGFMADLKKALSGSFETEVKEVLEYLDTAIESAETAKKLLEETKKAFTGLENGKPQDIKKATKNHWEIDRAARRVSSTSDYLQSLEKKMENYI